MRRCVFMLAALLAAADDAATTNVAVAPAGTFVMSALDQGTGQFEADGVTRRPGMVVTIARPLQVSRTEITQGEFQNTLHRNPSKFRDAADAALRPVEQVTLFDAVEYCNARSKRDGLAPRYTLANLARRTDGGIDFAVVKDVGGPGWRLPTEAEWEYLCRAGSTGPWCYGDDEQAIGTVSWSRDQSAGSTHAVGGKKPNAWGIFDMHGNVFEWCFDASAAPGARQPFRGGSWFNCPVCAKSDSRSMGDPATREATLGFRVVRTPD